MLTCSYSEAAFFDGNHCHHCAARDEFMRLARIAAEARRALNRRLRTDGAKNGISQR